MSDQFRVVLLPLSLVLMLSACAGNGPRRPASSDAERKSLAEQRSDFLVDCQRREELRQPRSPECPDSRSEPGLSQPTLGPLGGSIPNLPTLPGGLIR